jgi:type VI secretion system FHA domain protein
MSTLSLTVLRSPDHVHSQQHRAQGGELTIGRSAECDWPLPDPLKSLSRKHCTIEFSAGSWQVRDLSANGTFVNSLSSPVGRDLVQQLRDGDRLLLGDYEIEVRLEDATVAFEPLAQVVADSPFADAPRPGFAAVRLPGLDDPLDSPGGHVPAVRSDWPIADHSASSADAFVPPPLAPPNNKQLVPDDWFRAVDPAPVAAAPAFAAARPEPAVVPSPVPFPPHVPAPASVLDSTVPPPAVQRAVASAAVPADGDMVAALTALLAGGDLPPEMFARAAGDPEAALRNAGALLRAAVSGIRALLIARGSVKREFRIEQTMLRTKENNPLKFAASDEQALSALLDPRTQSLHAIEESINDLTVHQVATLAATQAAARALFEQMGPDKLEAEVTGGGLFSGALDKRRWEAYKRRHARLLEQFDDDFESAFGKSFARAYEQAVGRVKD